MRISAVTLLLFVLASTLFLGQAGVAEAGEWPAYRHSAARDAVADEPLPESLTKAWTFTPAHPPKTAWYEPSEETPRCHFDGAHHVTVAKGRVYFGSSVDGKVTALDAASGKILWSFYTGGPVRCAPTIEDGKLYFGSDDGLVYCIAAADGKVVWRRRLGPSDEVLLGNEHLISRWPIRTNVTVGGGVAYVAAGVFPHEGLYVVALDAKTGKTVWKNDTIGDREHELDYNGISPQGYLVLSDDALFVPSGRALPAAFDRKTGDLRYVMRPGGKFGGTWAMLDGERLVVGVDRLGVPAKETCDTHTGEPTSGPVSWFECRDLALVGEMPVLVTTDGVVALDPVELAKIRRPLRAGDEARRRLHALWVSLDEPTRAKISKALRALPQKKEKQGAPCGAHAEFDRLRKEEFLARTEANRLRTRFRKPKARNELVKWRLPSEDFAAVISDGSRAYAGGNGRVVAVDLQTGKEAWHAAVRGNAAGLAAAEDRLFVSTDKGDIVCFAPSGRASRSRLPDGTRTGMASSTPEHTFAGAKGDSEEMPGVATNILELGGTDKGYCVLLDAGDGRFACELAKTSEFQIIAVEHDPVKFAEARKRLDTAGLLGARVMLGSWNLADLPEYVGNVVTVGSAFDPGTSFPDAQQIHRLVRPYGGRVVLRVKDEKGAEALQARLQATGLKTSREIKAGATWIVATRGPLEGAGNWTHLYADPSNTACSGDRLVRGAMEVLWFGAPGPKGMLDRHARGQTPVSMDGRLFVQGEETVRAFDAYNGTPLWERTIPGAVRVRCTVDGGHFALAKDGLCVAADDKCYRLDPATGETLRVYGIPGAKEGDPRRWGYIARAGNLLYGSAAAPMEHEFAAVWKALVTPDGKWRPKEDVPEDLHVYYDKYIKQYPVADERLRKAFKREAVNWGPMNRWRVGGEFFLKQAKTERTLVGNLLFALDVETGEPAWTHAGGAIAHITVSIGDGMIYFTDADVTPAERKEAVRCRKELAEKGVFVEGEDWNEHFLGRRGYEMTEADYDIRRVTALDATTGEKRWERLVDLTGCAGDAMASAYHDGVLLFFGSHGNHDAWRHFGGQLKFRRVTVLDAKTGEMRWSRSLDYRTRPLIVGNRLIVEPFAVDVKTGRPITRIHPVTGKEVPWEFVRPGHCCAITSASSEMLFFRSYTTMMVDMENDRGLTLFGAIRPGCFINLIPAGGLVLFPEASSGCTCSFPVKCSIAFKPRDDEATEVPPEWTVFVARNPLTPVKHLAINFGAPGDMKAADGTLWLRYPRPDTNYLGNHAADYGVRFSLNESIEGGRGFFAHDYRGNRFAGVEKPWLAASGCEGLKSCSIPLLDPNKDAPATYRVRLGLTPRPDGAKAAAPCDIRLQDNTVATGVTLAGAEDGPGHPMVREFEGIHVNESLRLELISEHPPVVNFVEIVRE